MKRKISLIEPIDDPVRIVAKRFKEKRTKILKQSLKKLKQIPDAEQCLRQAVLIRNTFIRAKDLSPKTFERQLSDISADAMLKDNSDLLTDLIDNQTNNNTDEMVTEQSHSYTPQEVAEQDKVSQQSYQSPADSVSKSVAADLIDSTSRQMVVVS